MPGFADFAGFAGVVEIYTVKHKRVFILSGWTVRGNELVFVFSFVSSNNTDVETTEQFIPLHTRYVCDFSGLTNFSHKLWNSTRTFISYRIVYCLMLRFSCFWPAMNSLIPSKEKSFALTLRLDFRRSLVPGLPSPSGRSAGSFPEQQLVIEPTWDSGLLISKISDRTVYPEKLFPWPPVCLLSSENVVSFFICEEC